MSRERGFGGGEEFETRPKRTHYEILGVSPRATIEEIKLAFRKRAIETHPDRPENAGKEQEFKEANNAIQVLSDPQKRRTYDLEMTSTFVAERGESRSEQKISSTRTIVRDSDRQYIIDPRTKKRESDFYQAITVQDRFVIATCFRENHQVLLNVDGKQLSDRYDSIRFEDGLLIGRKGSLECLLSQTDGRSVSPEYLKIVRRDGKIFGQDSYHTDREEEINVRGYRPARDVNASEWA